MVRRGVQVFAPTIEATLRSHILVRFQQITFALSKLTNFRALFPAESTDFPSNLEGAWK